VDFAAKGLSRGVWCYNRGAVRQWFLGVAGDDELATCDLERLKYETAMSIVGVERQTHEGHGRTFGFGPAERDVGAGRSLADLLKETGQRHGYQSGSRVIDSHGDFVGLIGEADIARERDNRFDAVPLIANREAHNAIIDCDSGLRYAGRERLREFLGKIGRQPAVDLIGRKTNFPAACVIELIVQGQGVLLKTPATLVLDFGGRRQGLAVKCGDRSRRLIDARQCRHHHECKRRSSDQQAASEFPHRVLGEKRSYWIVRPSPRSGLKKASQLLGATGC
jgi:hypothetical protein